MSLTSLTHFSVKGSFFIPEACYEPHKTALLKDCLFILQKKDNGVSSNTCKFVFKIAKLWKENIFYTFCFLRLDENHIYHSQNEALYLIM